MRAALGGDDWSGWCGPAAEVGAAGFVDVEDDGSYTGRLEIRDEQICFTPPARRQFTSPDRAGEAEVFAILQAVMQQEMTAARQRAARKQSAAKQPAARKFAAR